MSLIGKYMLLTLLSGSANNNYYMRRVSNIDENVIGQNSNINCKAKVGGDDDYFILGNGQKTWEDAREACNECNSSLPIIRNKTEEEALSQFLRNHSMTSGVWTAGTKAEGSRWKWINQVANTFLPGPPVRNGLETVSGNDSINSTHLSCRSALGKTDDARTPIDVHGSGTAARLTRELKYIAQDPRHPIFYVCQFKSNDPFCSSGTTQKIILNYGCLNTTEPVKDAKWYEARNDCLERGGDLPVLDDSDLNKLNASVWPDKSLAGTRIEQLWLGLRSSSWTWYSNKTDDIKYSNWRNLTDPDPSGVHCIAIDERDGKWKPYDCSQKLQFVCERRGSPTHPFLDSTTKTTTTAEPPPISITKSTTASRRPSRSMTKATTTSKAPFSSTIKTTTTSKAPFSSVTNSTTPAQLPPSSDYATDTSGLSVYTVSGIAVAVVIICIIIVIIIIIIIAIRNRRKSSNRTTGNPESTAGPETNLDKPHGNNSYGVYAEIPLETTSNTEDAGNSHPGIVYASLDLGNSVQNSNMAPANKTYPQGDIYAEVNKPKTDGKPVQSKIGPLGDVYAQVNHNTAQPSPKIGPLGDVYAQVNHNTTQPSQEQRDRSIYDNL